MAPGTCSETFQVFRKNATTRPSKRCQGYPPPAAGPPPGSRIAIEKIVCSTRDPHKNHSQRAANYANDRCEQKKFLIPALFKWDHF